MQKKRKILTSLIVGVLVVIVVVTIVLSSLSSSNPQYGITSGSITYELDDGDDISDEVKSSTEPVEVASNETLRLLIDASCNIILQDSVTGKVYSSAVAEDLKTKFADSDEALSSIVELTYNSKDSTPTTVYSSNQAIARDQFTVSKIENGVKIALLFGETSENELIPYAVEKERFEKDLLGALDEDDAEALQRRYTLYSKESAVEVGQDELIEQVPQLANKDFYIQNEISGKVAKQKLKQLFEKMGYTAEDLATDNDQSGYVGNEITPCFRIVMELTLEDNELVMNIPQNEIIFYRDYPLMNITPLKYFLSATDTNGGFLIPSGSGAVSEFKPGSRIGSYTANFYGEDNSKSSIGSQQEMEITDDRLTMPIYAMQTGNDAVLAIIENSEESAKLTVNRENNSAHIFTEFTVLQSERSYLSDNKSMTLFAEKTSGQDITVRYRFIHDMLQNCIIDYSKIANEYREFLYENKTLTNLDDEQSHLLLEYVGAVKSPKEILGLINTEGLLTLTTFEDMQLMTDSFVNKTDIGYVDVKISGWNQGGLYGNNPGKTSPLSQLGGKRGLNALTNYLTEKTDNLFLEANHAFYYDKKLFDGFNTKKAVRFVDNSIGVVDGYNSVYGMHDEDIDGSYIISPSEYLDIVKKYIDKNLSGVSAGRFGSVLNSDYLRGENITRNDALKLTVSALEKYHTDNVPVSVVDADEYAFSYIDLIESMPTTALSNSGMFDCDVPFKQMVLHGSVVYTISPINAETNSQIALLKAIETGSGLHYVFTKNTDEMLAKTTFSYLYYSNFDVGYANAVSAWQELQTALEGLGNEKIISHSSDGILAKTTYSDGTVIFVNYSDQAIGTEYGIVAPMSYARF